MVWSKETIFLEALVFTWHYVSKSNSCHCYKTEIEGIKKRNILINADKISTTTETIHQNIDSIVAAGLMMLLSQCILHQLSHNTQWNFDGFLRNRQSRSRAPPAVLILSMKPTSIFSVSSSSWSSTSSLSQPSLFSSLTVKVFE